MRRRTMSRAEVTRRLLDIGYSPIEAHEATAQGTVPDDLFDEPSIIEEMEAAAGG